MSQDVECPYCEAGLKVKHDDGFGYEQDVAHEMRCENCDKSFVFYTSVIYHYEAQKADCLNGGDHDWRKTHTFPEECSRMECYACGELREMTNQERKSFGIGTVDEYIESLNRNNESK